MSNGWMTSLILGGKRIEPSRVVAEVVAEYQTEGWSLRVSLESEGIFLEVLNPQGKVVAEELKQIDDWKDSVLMSESWRRCVAKSEQEALEIRKRHERDGTVPPTRSWGNY